ncbi:MAG: GAF domain-containing protein [Comamonadaceae bacterium]|nr:MAG: GAF domain-containing protein [Comamonadaceae bacterium]
MTRIRLQSIAQDLLMRASVTRVMLVDCAPDGHCDVLAEAVAREADQLRHARPLPTFVGAAAIETLSRTAAPLVEDAQVLVPIQVNGKFRGIVVLQDDQTRYWGETERNLAAVAALATAEALEQQDRQTLDCRLEDLRNAAIESILDQLRTQMDVQRCTFRQDVSTEVVFPVTHESRSPGTRSLVGDLTIVLNGQPVVEQMTRLRAQVVQNDTSIASDEPQFHRMLRHYGNMRSQIVTPLFDDTRLVGAVSVHDLCRTREWTSDEKAFAQEASRLLGLVAGVGGVGRG